MRRACIILFCLILCGISYAEYPQIVQQSLARISYVSPNGDSRGSGVVINQEYVLTCHHIIREKPGGKFSIIISTGKESRNLGAEVIKINPEKDLMLLKLSEPVPWKTTSPAKEFKWGERIYFGGYSALPLPKIRIGFATKRSQGIYLHPIYFGDSGGGVFNKKQKLMGIIYLTYEIGGIPSLVGYAIPLEDIREFLENEIPM